MEVPLTDNNNNSRWAGTTSLQTSFILMSLCFSINHGCVTAVLGLASAQLGQELGGVSSGTLYILYTLSALIIATALVAKLGAKWSLVCGLALYCTYVASFLIAVKVEGSKWIAAIIGSVIGGTAAGWLWTAQGLYFARTAERYAMAKGVSKEAATSWLASIFAICYVGFEVILKLASSFLYEFGSDTFVYTIFTLVAAACPFLMLFVGPEPPPLDQAAENANKISTWGRIAEAGKLLVTDPKMQLISGFEIMFGLSTSFLNEYINGEIVKAAIGKKNIGYMTAIVPATATLLAWPYSKLSSSVGKGPVMIFGCISYLLIAVIIISISNDNLEKLKWGLCFIYIIAGNGRGIFEGTNKAAIADLFPNQKSAAFANVIVTSGGASAVAFYVFPLISKLAMGLVCSIACVVGIFGVYLVFKLKSNEKEGFKELDAEEGKEVKEVTIDG